MNKKIATAISFIVINTIFVYANDIGNFSGTIRLGYQYDNISLDGVDEFALKGMLHYETMPFDNLFFGATVETIQGNGKSDKIDCFLVPFFDNDNKNYTILSELYLKGTFEKNEITLGRQTIDTPFADSDDIGMMPNRFEAAMLVNKDFPNTILTAGNINSMAGVDANRHNKFTKINDNDGVYFLGINYDGIDNLALQGWYYYGNDFAKIGFLEAVYSSKSDVIDYSAGVQYANQNYDNNSNNIYGAMIAINNEKMGLGVTMGYNKTNGIEATNFLAGGPFFTSIEHTTITNAGDNGKTYKAGIKWRADAIGIDGLELCVEHLWIDRSELTNARNLGFIIKYAYSDAVSLRAFYNVIKDKQEDDCNNIRIFMDYKF
ncbi:MAG: OprD family outer membrane porin [Sulfurovaceae bacterium]|nr:OprD family outer membrane porin [Sulfurovaceae bacterium]